MRLRSLRWGPLRPGLLRWYRLLVAPWRMGPFRKGALPPLRPGPLLALLFAAGIHLEDRSAGLVLAGEPRLEAPPEAGAPLAAPPLLRWCSAALLLLACVGSPPRRRLAVGLLFIALGALRAAGARSPSLLPVAAGPVRVEAWVAEVAVVIEPEIAAPGSPARSGSGPRTLFETRDPAVAVSVEGRVDWIRPGQRVRLEGRLEPARDWRNPGRPPPSRLPLLRVERPEQVLVLEEGLFRRPLRDGALLLRERAHRVLSQLYGPRTHGFLAAMLLGDRRLLPDEWRRSMALTGTIHFLAVSGLNVGMAMALVVRLPLDRRLRLPARLGFLLLFTLVTGAAPPVARAAVMLALHCLGQAFRRAPRPVDTLGWAALFLLALEPGWAFDLGFALSVAAVLAMALWVPSLLGEGDPDRRLAALARLGSSGGRVRESLRRGLEAVRRAAVVSLACSAGTAPLVLWSFYRLHPLGPLWNLAAAPLVNAVLLLAGASVALGAIHPVIGMPAAALAECAAEFLLWSLSRMEAVPGSCLYLPPPPAWAVFAGQALLVLGALPAVRRAALAGALLVAALLLGAAAVSPARPSLLVLDTGGGSCALLDVPGSGAVLFDCGAGERTRKAGERLGRSLLASGVRRLDGILLSHAHADHVGGALELLEVVPAARVWVSPLFEGFPLGKWLLAELERRGVPVEVLARGQEVRVGRNLLLEALHPARGEPFSLALSPNEGSLVIRASFGGTSVLFPGDIEEAGTARLLSTGDDLRAEVLLLPHHARRSGLGGEFLEGVRPRAGVASGDGSGGGRETAAALRAEGVPVHATWEEGAVRGTLEAGGWSFAPAAR